MAHYLWNIFLPYRDCKNILLPIVGSLEYLWNIFLPLYKLKEYFIAYGYGWIIVAQEYLSYSKSPIICMFRFFQDTF